MGKKRGPYNSKDTQKLLALLEYLYEKNELPIDKLDEFFKSKGFDTGKPEKTTFIIESLLNSELPIMLVGNNLVWEGLFEGHPVGQRIYVNSQSKKLLARKVLDLLIAQDPPVSSILIGAGTSTLAVTFELINQSTKFKSLVEIYTNNLLALTKLIRNLGKLNIRIPEGGINMRDGAITSTDGLERLKECQYDAVITSFYGLSFDKGFSSDHKGDRIEKLYNLNPDNCSTIYIPLDWIKIGRVKDVVASRTEGIANGKKYMIVTNPPKNWMNDPDQEDKVKEIGKWGDEYDKGQVEFVFVDEDEY